MRTPLLSTLASLILLCAEVSYAQMELPYGSAFDAKLPEWTRLMYSPSPDPGEVIEAYEQYYSQNPFIKNGHTQYYKRWLHDISRSLPGLKNQRDPQRINRSIPANWECIGPFDWDHHSVDRSYAPGAAHVYTVEQSISNPDVLYAGTATGGLWKSTDRGLSWTAVSDHMRTGSVTAIEINNRRAETVYAELLNSIYKSKNGGTSWAPTGNGAFQGLSLDVNDIVMHPIDTSIVLAATHNALYRTTNGGSSWTSVVSGDFLEIEFHPTRPDTIYAVRHNGDKTEFYRSLNTGASFQLLSNGWPSPNIALGEHQRRTEIAVSPDEPDLIYALATGMANGGSGLYGMYQSTDAGNSWTFECCGEGPGGPPSLDNPNLMGWNDDGTDDGGQYYYDLALSVSPTNADSVFVAGVNLWVSADGGESFVCPAKWSHPHKPNYVHADIHDIHFYPGTHELWVACDGGIFRSTDNGANFIRKLNGICGTDFWGFGAGYWDGDIMLGGTYHNGTLMKDGDVYHNGWISTDGGDNFRGFVNPGKPREAYSDYNIKTLSGDRNVNCTARSFVNKPNASYIVGESSDLLFHPQYYGTWYSGSGSRIWKTVDDGFTFQMLHDFGANVTAMDISISNPNVLYATTWPGWWSTKRIYRSDDGGDNWVEITPSSGTLNGNTWVPYDIAVDAGNPMKIWIVRTSMYGDTELDGYVVFTSSNGGSSWQNISTAALNDEAFTCIVHQAGTNGGVYLGTRESVYYRNAYMTDWAWYGDGLPAATFCTRMIPYYKEGKMRSGTNRSIWESPFYEASHPIAQPSTVTRVHDCIMDTVYFMDHSVVNEENATWLWQMPGATPSTSTARNPKVVYNSPGIYSVTLTVGDVNGTDSYVADGIIEVRDLCSLDPFPGKALKTNAYPDYAVVPDLDATGNTFTISAWVRPAGLQSDYSAIVMSDDVACGLNFREGNNTLGYHWAGSGQAWSWDSNLPVPADKWSHVAMVVSATSVRLYVNGQQATHAISHSAVTLSTMKIGSYQGWQSRNFKGQIDEVCIWNRSLTQDEIRALRHLTKNPANDTGLLAYYQFNEENSIIYDKAHDYDAQMNGSALRIKSRAPVGQGISQSLNILLPGDYTFSQAGLTISFPSGGVVPLGLVYLSKLNVLPDTLVFGSVPMDAGYWIFNNYGINQQVTSPDLMELEGLAFISDEMEVSLDGDFYHRGANIDNGGWQLGSAQSGELEPGFSGDITFNNIVSSFNQLGQILAVRDSMLHGRPKIAMVHEADTSVYQRGGSSLALSLQSTTKGLLLPRYTSAALQAIPSPPDGSIAFVTDLKEIACFNGSTWKTIAAEYIEPPVYTGLGESGGFGLGGGSAASALLSLGTSTGLLVLPSFTEGNLTEIDFPRQGLLLYQSTLNKLMYYDGIDWVNPPFTSTALTANSADSYQNLPGILVGTGTKDPNALMQISDAQRALGLPIVSIDAVNAPHAGLLVFDPDLKALCVFDGAGWKAVR